MLISNKFLQLDITCIKINFRISKQGERLHIGAAFGIANRGKKGLQIEVALMIRAKITNQDKGITNGGQRLHTGAEIINQCRTNVKNFATMVFA